MIKIETRTIQFQTRGRTDIIDLTPGIKEQLADTGMKEGQVSVFAIGSTTGISTLEYEPGLVNHDVHNMFEKLAPYLEPYRHNQTWGDDNGSAHLRSLLTGTSYSAPFSGGKLLLGTWQQIVFLDFDTRPRERRVVLQFFGK